MSNTDAPRISIVIPVYNEADSLRELHAQITAVARPGAAPA